VADIHEPFYLELVAQVAAALPAVPDAGGIWTMDAVMRTSLEDTLTNHGAPLVVIDELGGDAADWGASNDSYENLYDIYVILQGEDRAALNTAIAALRDQFEAEVAAVTTLYGQVLRVLRWRVTPTAIPSEWRAVNKQLNIRVGSVTIACVVGENAA